MVESVFINEVFDQVSKFEKDQIEKLREMDSKILFMTSDTDFKKELFKKVLNNCCKKSSVDKMLVCISWVAKLAYDCGLMDGKGYNNLLQDTCEEMIKEREKNVIERCDKEEE